MDQRAILCHLNSLVEITVVKSYFQVLLSSLCPYSLKIKRPFFYFQVSREGRVSVISTHAHSLSVSRWGCQNFLRCQAEAHGSLMPLSYELLSVTHPTMPEYSIQPLFFSQTPRCSVLHEKQTVTGVDTWPVPSLLLCLLCGQVSFRVSLYFLNMRVLGTRNCSNHIFFVIVLHLMCRHKDLIPSPLISLDMIMCI